MNLFAKIVALLFFACINNLAFAQVSGSEQEMTAIKNDEQSVKYIVDSVSRLRIAKAESNDPMPGTQRRRPKSDESNRALNLYTPATYLLVTSGEPKVLPVSALKHMLESEWVKSMNINTDPVKLRKYTLRKNESLVMVSVKDEVFPDAIKVLESTGKQIEPCH
jgi:hypothetical protein